MFTPKATSIQTPTNLNHSIDSEISVSSRTVADPVVRYVSVIHRTKNKWRSLYSLSSDTAQILLQGEVKKKKLEKTNKKSKRRVSKGKFGADITQKIKEVEEGQKRTSRKISEEVTHELLQEDKHIQKESSKLVKMLPKLRLKLGQRLPINSKVTQGKWFIQLVQPDMLVLVLTFAGSDEMSLGRLLIKITSALLEGYQELENPRRLKQDIDKVIRNYGFYNFESKNMIVPPSKVILEETVLNEEGLVRRDKLNNVKTVQKIKKFSNEEFQERVDPKFVPDFSTCESPLMIPHITPPVRPSQKYMDNFFKSEPIQTPKKPYKKKMSSNPLKLEDISKIEMKSEDFDDKDEDIDFFEFEVIKEDKEPGRAVETKAFPKPPSSPNKLCIDLSKKFDRCVYNHKIMNSASKQIKNFDSEHFTNFSSSAKKMIPKRNFFDFSSKKKKKEKSVNTKEEFDKMSLIKESKRTENWYNNREFWARLGLGCLMLMVLVVMMKMFLEINGNGEISSNNRMVFEHGGGRRNFMK
jgi:hypothetical protein